MKIFQLPARYLARLVNANEMNGGTLIAQVVPNASHIAKLHTGTRRKVAGLVSVAEPRALNAIPPGYRTIHDSVRKAEISIGLAEYQRPIVRMLDVLDGGHKQVRGLPGPAAPP